MSKPNVNEVLDIVRMKYEATALYDEIDRRVAEMMAEFGAGRFDYDLDGFLDKWNTDNESPFDELIEKGGRYLKFEIEDNVQKLQGGGTVWKSAAFKPVSFSSRSLKHCPESLK